MPTGKLHHKLFFAATLAAVGSLVTAWLVSRAFGIGPEPHRELRGAEGLLASQFRAAWDDPAARLRLAEDLHRHLGATVTLHVDGSPMGQRVGPECDGPSHSIAIADVGESADAVTVCMPGLGPGRGVLVLVIGAGLFWIATGAIAWRIMRPVSDVIDVAERIGAGNWDARVSRRRHLRGEVGVLARAINEMASKVQRQMSDQRELLAAVSHELRSPLSHIRVLVDLARHGDAARHLDALDAEVVQVDRLIDELLASSRLDFSAHEPKRQPARALCERALVRAGLAEDLLVDEARGVEVEVDAALVVRALGNLVENAVRHAGAVERVEVTAGDGRVRFSVLDRGPGFDAEALSKGFEAFFRGQRRAGSGLGLGLALVRRIAEAHGGSVSARNREGGGAVVTFEVPEPPPAER